MGRSARRARVAESLSRALPVSVERNSRHLSVTDLRQPLLHFLGCCLVLIESLLDCRVDAADEALSLIDARLLQRMRREEVLNQTGLRLSRREENAEEFRDSLWTD